MSVLSLCKIGRVSSDTRCCFNRKKNGEECYQCKLHNVGISYSSLLETFELAIIQLSLFMISDK